jgi:ribosomal-protein-alanine acetyltransferase
MPIRRGEPDDLDRVAAIQRACCEATQWDVGEYLQYDLLVSVRNQDIAGFAVCRTVAPGERELLNLAVAPGWRRQGVARELVSTILTAGAGPVYLEVRASNQVARKFYKYMGFQEIAVRPAYYDSPPEAAIVMKFHSC